MLYDPGTEAWTTMEYGICTPSRLRLAGSSGAVSVSLPGHRVTVARVSMSDAGARFAGRCAAPPPQNPPLSACQLPAPENFLADDPCRVRVANPYNKHITSSSLFPLALPAHGKNAREHLLHCPRPCFFLAPAAALISLLLERDSANVQRAARQNLPGAPYISTCAPFV